MLSNALSAKKVETARDGKYRDGEGLQYEVKGGSRRWVFSYMWNGKQREIAIGKYPGMSLAEARMKRSELRDAKARGIDPKTVLKAVPPIKTAATFRLDTEAYFVVNEGSWTAGHASNWIGSMRTPCVPKDRGSPDSGSDLSRDRRSLGTDLDY